MNTKNSPIYFILFVISIINASAQTTTMVWENQGFSGGDEITSGTILNEPNGVIEVTATWSTVINGGSFVPADTYFLEFASGTQGGHVGHAEMGFNNSDDDPNDQIIVTLTFDPAVTGLQFSLLDIDDGDDGMSINWDDGIEVYYNGNNNIKGTGFATLVGGNAVEDNEAYMDGYEGANESIQSSTASNLDFDFGSTEITNITVYYFSTDDAKSNPNDQYVGFSDLTFDAATSLPVDLMHFNIKPEHNIVILEWATVSEINNDYFEVERSEDGKSWTSICKMPGQGNSQLEYHYTARDEQPKIGLSYYRLKQIDYDGSISYSEIKSVEFRDSGPTSTRLYPLPANAFLHIESMVESPIRKVHIFDAFGKLIQVPIVEKQQNRWTIDVSKLATGTYIGRVTRSTRIESYKFFVQ